jgi:hypothetical protein
MHLLIFNRITRQVNPPTLSGVPSFSYFYDSSLTKIMFFDRNNIWPQLNTPNLFCDFSLSLCVVQVGIWHSQVQNSDDVVKVCWGLAFGNLLISVPI